MTKHYSSPIANIGSQSANDTLKNALKESGKSGGYYITKEAKNNLIFAEEQLFYVAPLRALWSGAVFPMLRAAPGACMRLPLFHTPCDFAS